MTKIRAIISGFRIDFIGDIMRKNKTKKEEFSLFTAQCAVSAALILAGVLIYNARTPFLQPAQVAFSQVITQNGNIEELSEAVNTFVDNSEFLSGILNNEQD